MKTNKVHTMVEDETMLGQLIAEISKFGGSNKEDASRLARILLPHINAYTTNKIIEEVNHHIDKAQSNLRRKYQLNRNQRHGMDILSEEIREQLAELKALNHRKDKHG